MKSEEYEVMYRIEDDFWWYRGMRKIIGTLIESAFPLSSHLVILDAGCGTGGAFSVMKKFGRVLACDYSPHALRFCLERRIDRGVLALASVDALPYQPGSFDLITCFDVLCNVDDDEKALKSFHASLKPGGKVLISVPAYPFLRGEHDIAVQSRRRYTRKPLKHKIQAAGFEIERMTYANTLLFPLAAVIRLAKKWPAKNMEDARSDLKTLPGPLNQCLAFFLSLESRFLKKIEMPFGLSLFCLARRD